MVLSEDKEIAKIEELIVFYSVPRRTYSLQRTPFPLTTCNLSLTTILNSTHKNKSPFQSVRLKRDQT